MSEQDSKLIFGDLSSIAFRNRLAGKPIGSGVPSAARTTSRWRLHSRDVIAKVFSENRGLNEKAMRKAMSAAYPFGLREYTPYKIWLQEVNSAIRTRYSK